MVSLYFRMLSHIYIKKLVDIDQKFDINIHNDNYSSMIAKIRLPLGVAASLSSSGQGSLITSFRYL